MNIEEARLYLEHTSKEDFNLEEWQKENRYQAIQVVLKEIERLNNIIDNARDYIMNNQSGGESKNGHFHINFDGDIWELYEMLRRY